MRLFVEIDARLAGDLEDAHLGVVRVEAVTLFESRTSPAGPAYLPLLRLARAGPRADGWQS